VQVLRQSQGMQKITTDIAIIGAGPAGLFAVFQCGMLKMSCVLIDTLSDAWRCTRRSRSTTFRRIRASRPPR
jgi:succinate dehydrogenase/fumarate reductase flavoprotein subunit